MPAGSAAMFGWLLAQGQKRSRRIEYYAAIGRAPENKVTPNSPRRRAPGLHPLAVWVDEIQELFSLGRTG